jgi:hypothetical protein
VVKVKGVMETRELEAEGEDKAASREALLAPVPEGWQVLYVMTAR